MVFDKTSGTPVAAVFLPSNDAVAISFILKRVTALSAIAVVPSPVDVTAPVWFG